MLFRAATVAVAVVVVRAATVAVARAATVAVAVVVAVWFKPFHNPFALSARAAGGSKGHPDPLHAVAFEVAVASAFDLGPRVWSHVAGAEIG